MSAHAHRLASDWGVGHLPDRMEPRARSLTRALLDASEDADDLDRRIEIKAFGAFMVRRGTHVLPTPPGVATTVLKLLAVAGGSVTIDVAINTLWPDVPSDVGRRRFRNVMSRAREVTGGAVERVNDTIVFSPNVSVDVCEFDENCKAVQRLRTEDPVRAAAIARAALTSYDTLLVEDFYEDWIAEPRAALRRRAAALIDIVVADGVDAATGAWLADLVTGIDPFDDGRLVRLAGVLNEAGAGTLAAALLAGAAAIAADLAGP